MAITFLLLVLPALVLAEIKLFFDVEVKQDVGIHHKIGLGEVLLSGHDTDIITDAERKTFKVEDEALLNAVSVCNGRRPVTASLRNEENLVYHRLYNYTQVNRIFAPLDNASVLESSTERVHLHHMLFENGGTNAASINVGVSDILQNTISSSWITEGELSIGQNIEHGIKIKFVDAGKETSLYYNSAWRKNTELSQNVTVGPTLPVVYTLSPGQTVVSDLYLTRGYIQMQVEYSATLRGQVVAHYYSPPYRGLNMYGIEIDDCLRKYGNSNNVVSREIIDLRFIIDAIFVVTDKQTGTILMVDSF